MASASNSEFRLTGPRVDEFQSVSALTLSCHLSPEISAFSMEIRWFKGTDCVCLYKNGQLTEGRGYEGRVSLSMQELERGNVSLQLRDCTESDTGHYLCQVSSGDTAEECTVKVRDLSPLRKGVFIVQLGDRKWTEEETIKMEESVLLTELKEKRFPGPVLKNLLSLMEEKKALEKQLKKAEAELENVTKHSHSNEEQQQREEINGKNEIDLEIRETQERLVRGRVELRQKEEKKTREEMSALVDALRSSAEPAEKLMQKMKQHETRKHECRRRLAQEKNVGKKRELEREVEREDEQTKKAKQEWKRTQEERRSMVKKHRLEVKIRERNAVKADKYFISTLSELVTQALIMKRQAEFGKIMKERDSERETLKRNLSEMEKDKDEQIEEKNKTLEDKNQQLKAKKEQLEALGEDLQDKSSKLQMMLSLLEQQKSELTEKERQLEGKERLLSERDMQLRERDKQVEEKDKLLEERKKQPWERTDPRFVVLQRRHSRDWNNPSLSEESPESVPATELRLMLLGRTKYEKNAAGNTILGRAVSNQARLSTVRQQSESRQGEVSGRQVTVVDTPDWFCPEASQEGLRQDVGLCIRLSAPGPHAFLLVIPVKQSTGEEGGMLEKVEEIFGDKCWRNTMILFTVTDEVQEKNIEELVQSGTQEVQRLVEKCGNRFHCLNIKESGDGSQITELLEKIEKMVGGNREKFYSSEVYLETESQIRELEKRILREREEMRAKQERGTNEKLQRRLEEVLMQFQESTANFHAQITQHEEQISQLQRMLEEERDDTRKVELKRQLEREIQRRNEVQLELERLKEEAETEKREMEERHRQEMEEIRETYEGEAKMEAERTLMKIVLPELQQRMWEVMTKKQKEFDCRMDEKEREIEALRQRLRERVRGGITAGGAGHQDDTAGLFRRLTQRLFWTGLSDPVISTRSDQ